MEKRFNLRVYGIIRNAQGEVLVSDECRRGVAFTKFPGGGLEWEEGLHDCLQRELQEELNIDAKIGSLFYVNEFYQESAFRKTDQLISFYFNVGDYSGEILTSHHTVPITEETEKFRWVPIAELHPDMMTFPIDKIVAQKLNQKI